MANDHMYRGMVLSRAVEFRGREGRGTGWREGWRAGWGRGGRVP